MRTRVSATTLKRLDAIREQREKGLERRKYVKLPAILSIEAWEAIAIPSQKALMAAAAEDLELAQPNTPTPPSMPPAAPAATAPQRRYDGAPIPRPPRAPKVYEE